MNHDRDYIQQKAPFKKVLSGLSGLVDSRKVSNNSGGNFEPEFGAGAHRIDFQLSQNAGSRAFDVSQEFTEKTIFPAPLQAYNPLQCPPDFTKAEKHRIAHRVSPIHFRSEHDEICESTGMVVNYNRIGLWSPLSAVHHLGPVVPMYMHFIRQLTIIVFLFCSIPVTICALQKKFLIPHYIEFLDIIMEEQQQVMTLIIAPLCLFLLLTILLYYFRRSQKKMKLACKKLALTPSDYTIMCENMGLAYNPEEVHDFFSKHVLLGFNLDVVKTVITYDIEDYSNKIRKLDQCLKSKKEFTKLGVSNDNIVNTLDTQINRIDSYINQVRKARPKHQGLQRTGLCFVTFSTKQEAKAVRRRYEMSFFEKISVWLMHRCMEEFPEHFFKNQYIQVQKAPELYEIVWEDLSCNSSRYCAGFLNLLAYPGIILITFLSTLFIKKSEVEQGPYIIAIIIAITNEILKYTVRLLIRYEKFKTITELQTSLAYRITILQFINLTVPLLITVAILSKHFSELGFDVFIIAAINFTLPLAIRLINFPFILKRLQARKIRQQGESCNLTQEEANRIFEDPEFQIWLLYPTIITTFLFTCLFCSISPGVPLISFVTLFLLYWVDKYNLLRRSLVPTNMRSELAEAMFEFVDFGLFLLTFGTYILFVFARNESAAASDIIEYEILCIFAFVVASIYLVLPHKRLSRNCFSNTKSLTRRDAILYQQAAEYLHNDYQTVNPVSLGHPDPKDFALQYHKTVKVMGELKTIQEAPELLSIFDYARRRPSLDKIWTNGYKGLGNPYYYFPQSYGYGFLPLTLHSNLKGNDDQEIDIHTPFLGKPTKETEIFDMAKSNHSIGSKDPLIIDGSLYTNSKGREFVTSQKGNSIMNDLKMMPSFTGGEERKPDDSFGAGASANFSGSFGFEKVSKEDQSSFVPFNHSVSPIDNQDISPILKKSGEGSLKFEEYDSK